MAFIDSDDVTVVSSASDCREVVTELLRLVEARQAELSWGAEWHDSTDRGGAAVSDFVSGLADAATPARREYSVRLHVRLKDPRLTASARTSMKDFIKR